MTLLSKRVLTIHLRFTNIKEDAAVNFRYIVNAKCKGQNSKLNKKVVPI